MYLFCRNHILFLSRESETGGIQALQSDMEKGFNIIVSEGEIYVFCRKTNGKNTVFKLTENGVLNCSAYENVLSLSADDLFVYGKNTAVVI